MGRKPTIQALTNKDISVTDIIQQIRSEHKNLQSVTNYSVVPEKQQVQMSHTLSEQGECMILQNKIYLKVLVLRPQVIQPVRRRLST